MSSNEIPAACIIAAQTAQEQWRVPASVSLAQWCLESNYGKAMPPGSNNPFGIKAAAGQPYVTTRTHEYIHGRYVAVDAKFAKFASLNAAFLAHAQLLATHHAYSLAMSHTNDPDAFADALTGVYATDPHYGAKLVMIMHTHDLQQYDHPQGINT